MSKNWVAKRCLHCQLSAVFSGMSLENNIIGCSIPFLRAIRGHVAAITISMLLFSVIASGTDELTSFKFSSDTVLSVDIEIPSGASCVIEPGTHIQFEGYRTFTVRGLIIAEGTPDRPIVFTGVDRERGSRERPSWKGFEIVGKQAHGSFKNCRFEGAFRNLVWQSSPVFDSCEFAGNHYGLYCTRKATPHIRNCRIHRNAYGIASDFASPLLLDNLITENSVGVYLQLSSKALLGRNTIVSNDTDIKSEEALGENPSSLSIQHMWKLIQQLY